MKKEELHVFEGQNGTTKVRRTAQGDLVIDSYMGDVRDPNNHDRLSLNVTQGTLSGHDFEHKGFFNTGKDNTQTKSK